MKQRRGRPRSPGRTVEEAGATMGEVLAEYRQSPQFTKLAAATKRIYERQIGILREYSDLPIAGLRRRHILTLRDRQAHSPSQANQFLVTARVVMAFAVDREYRDANPAAGIKPLPVGEWDRWPEWAVEKFLQGADSEMAFAVSLALSTGQREGDLLRLRWSDYEQPFLNVVQQKTGAKLRIPLPDTMVALLADRKAAARSIYILHRANGQPWPAPAFQRSFRNTRKKLGLPDMLVFHGLRKTAVSRMAEAGCTPHEIMAISGHKSIAMIQHYSKGAAQEVRALAAIEKLNRRIK